MYIPVSPNPYDSISEEEAFSKVFNHNMGHIDIKEEINPENVYFIKGNKKQITQNAISFEDFDQFYKKFTDIEEVDEIEVENYERPSFYINFSQEKIFYPFENEKFVNVVFESGKKNKNKIKDCCEVDMNVENIEEKECLIIEDNNRDKLNNNSKYEKPMNIKNKNPEEKLFPFTQGIGIAQCLKNYEESCTSSDINNSNDKNSPGNNKGKSKQGDLTIKQSNSSENFDNSQKYTDNNTVDNNNKEENSIYTEQIMNGNEDFLFKFKTKKYFIAENGKKRRIKKKRKFKSDDIRKKIKSRFHKTFKNIINENLKKAGSKKLFDFFPQCFIGNVSKKLNSACLDLTYKELLLKDFISETTKDDYAHKNPDYKKYEKNKEVIEYLEKNPEICKKSGFDLIKDKKYKDLLNAYFSSGEFEDSIIRLKKENECKDYIQEYVLKAKNYVNFYYSFKNNEINEENSDDDN